MKKSTAQYLPLSEQDVGMKMKYQPYVIPFGILAWITVSLPFVAFLFCVIWSIIYHFETTVSTHCKVANLLPSISAAIGNESPQQEIWMLLIALHAPTRFCVVYMYADYFRRIVKSDILWIAAVISLLSVVENLSLLGLTFFSSSAYYPIHEKCFMTFIATSELYMILCCYLLGFKRASPSSNIESRSLQLKTKLLFINILSFAIAGYFFVRHNSYCEPYVYTFFALFEYIVVLTNMAFHMTSYLDFYDKKVNLCGHPDSPWIS